MRNHPINILLFVTDDHGGWALGCANNPTIHTPNLDKLAAHGTRFSHAYTPSPVCSPARACLATGRTPSQVGIHDWLDLYKLNTIATHKGLEGSPTLGNMLQDKGYRTGLSGKWHLENSTSRYSGFDWQFTLESGTGPHVGQLPAMLNGEPLPLEGSKTQHIANHACEFIKETNPDQPFFLQVGFMETHSPYHEANHDQAEVDLYADSTFDEVPHYKPHDWIKNESFPDPKDEELYPFEESFKLGDLAKERLTSQPTRENCLPYYRGYYAAVTAIDKAVGQILEELDRRNLTENTLIIYTSDHGCSIGHNGYWGKGNSTRPLNFYEPSVHVPLILKGPSIPSNVVKKYPVCHYDTFKTITSVAGIDLDQYNSKERPFPGVTLQFSEQPECADIFFEYGDIRGVRSAEFKATFRYGNGPDELYNLSGDPNEQVNLINDISMNDITSSLRRKLDAFYSTYTSTAFDGLNVINQPIHNSDEAWRDGLREARFPRPKDF